MRSISLFRLSQNFSIQEITLLSLSWLRGGQMQRPDCSWLFDWLCSNMQRDSGSWNVGSNFCFDCCENWQLQTMTNICSNSWGRYPKKILFVSGIGWIGGWVCPIFLVHSQEVHFWSIKGVFLFQNANYFNLNCSLVCIYIYYIVHYIVNIFTISYF